MARQGPRDLRPRLHPGLLPAPGPPVLEAGQHEEQVREPVQVDDRQRVTSGRARERDDRALTGAPADGARQAQERVAGRPAGQDERARRKGALAIVDLLSSRVTIACDGRLGLARASGGRPPVRLRLQQVGLHQGQQPLEPGSTARAGQHQPRGRRSSCRPRRTRRRAGGPWARDAAQARLGPRRWCGCRSHALTLTYGSRRTGRGNGNGYGNGRASTTAGAPSTPTGVPGSKRRRWTHAIAIGPGGRTAVVTRPTSAPTDVRRTRAPSTAQAPQPAAVAAASLQPATTSRPT